MGSEPIISPIDGEIDYSVAVRAERTVTAVLNICTQNPARRDEIAVFKGLALQALDNLSGDRA